MGGNPSGIGSLWSVNKEVFILVGISLAGGCRDRFSVQIVHILAKALLENRVRRRPSSYIIYW